MRAASRGALVAAFLAAFLQAAITAVTDVHAQDLEPRAYSNAPVARVLLGRRVL